MLILLIAAALVIAYVVHNAEPILRRRVIASLEQRFRSPVQLDALHISLLQGLEVSGSGLRIFLGEADRPDQLPPGAQPLLSVQNFAFRTGLRGLFEPVMHVSTVTVDGMQLTIPPKQANSGTLVPREKTLGKLKLSILMDRIICHNLTLTIATNQPGKLPLVFAIQDLTLNDVGSGKPFPFQAALINPKPVGNIQTSGNFGPWRADDPRETTVNGAFTFAHADLSTIKGIAGTLSSTGNYTGTLGEIGVVGATDTPDFALDLSEHPVNLHTQFNATVDGTNGDTILNSVHATLLHTVLNVTGKVVRVAEDQAAASTASEPTPHGHLINLSVTSDQARIEDLLRLGVKTSPPLMQGALTLHANINIPPGHISITQKMRIAGTFAIRSVTFSNPQWQTTVDKLSERASGNPEQANATDAARVTSAMSGNFALANAMLDIPKLDYQVPGAQVDVAGKYSLDGQTFDFNGIVRTQATASQMLTGWKSLLAMPLDRFFKKNGAGLQVPIKISGTRSTPKFGLDMDKLFSRSKDDAPTPPANPPSTPLPNSSRR
jgi:hypothetical protein